MIASAATKEELVDLLHELNNEGIVPTVAVLPMTDKYAEVVLFYGLDLGDEMGFEWFADPCEDAPWCEASDDHKVYPTHGLEKLPEGPYMLLFKSVEPGQIELDQFRDRVRVARDVINGLVEEHETKWWRARASTLAHEVLRMHGALPVGSIENPLPVFDAEADRG
jgi:hypothetical protein